MNFDYMTKKFILGEWKADKPTVTGYIQSIGELLESLKGRSKAERNRITMAKTHLREVRKRVKMLEEQVQVAEEKLTLLEEKLLVLEENKES
jgi:chromosome segregation ATPase